LIGGVEDIDFSGVASEGGGEAIRTLFPSFAWPFGTVVEPFMISGLNGS
jgi:hypothetical protein